MKPKLILAVVLGLLIGVAAGLYIGNKITGQPVNIEKEITVATSDREKSVKIYFSTLKDNEGFRDCTKTDFVIREIENDENIAQEMMMQLFEGPTKAEQEEGLIPFWITRENSGVLNKIFIKDGTAYLDWAENIAILSSGAGSSCGSQSFLSPVEMTLKTLPEVRNVVHAINGKPAAFYEWMQMDCGENDPKCDETPFL